MAPPSSRPPLRQRPAWSALTEHASRMAGAHLRDLFGSDSDRGHRLTAEGAGLYLDFAKQRVSDETVRLLVQLARECDLEGRRDEMFTGVHVNATEDRAALHVALRMGRGEALVVDGVDVVAQVHAEMDRMRDFCERVHSGAWRGQTGRPIRTIVNIGIGGSDLGPVMAYEALRHFSHRELALHFVSNVDASDLVEVLSVVDAEETLFIVASKTFTTIETMTNAFSARAWLVERLGADAVQHHFVAVSTNAARVSEFGIDLSNMFGFWDWVGGRYSLGSAIGLSTMLAIGPAHFDELLAGMRAMDHHFTSAPLDQNLPVLMGLIGVWNRDFLGMESVGVMPYEQHLHRFPAYLQQLIMESNGKHVTLAGERVDYATSPVYWGEPGTNGQHSFFQMLHQGTTIVAVDVIVVARSLTPLGDHQDILVANALAQAEALAFGRTLDEVRASGVADGDAVHRVMEGNRPSSVIMADELSPRVLGALIALYEHVVFTQSVVWDINPFDQWGVELGKVLATRIVPELDAAARAPLEHDSSTNALIERYRGRKR